MKESFRILHRFCYPNNTRTKCVVEKKHRHIMEIGTTLLFHAHFLSIYWLWSLLLLFSYKQNAYFYFTEHKCISKIMSYEP